VAAELEMYIKNTDGAEGEGDFLGQFGLEIRDEYVFTVSKTRWTQFTKEKFMTEVGYNFLLETGDELELESATGDGYSITSSRPLEGDLIYFPMVNELYEIKFVEHEAVYYQMGALQTYDIRCELFEYSSERIRTGNTSLDSIETTRTFDRLGFQFILETGDMFLLEDGSSTLILESFKLDTQDPINVNQFITSDSANNSIIDFSERNPFGDIEY